MYMYVHVCTSTDIICSSLELKALSEYISARLFIILMCTHKSQIYVAGRYNTIQYNTYLNVSTFSLLISWG